MVHACPSSYSRRMVLQAGLGKQQDLISKITRAKMVEILAQAEHLTNKCKTLSSSHSATKKGEEGCRNKETMSFVNLKLFSLHMNY
jgi:GTP cyclohydrolase I